MRSSVFFIMGGDWQICFYVPLLFTRQIITSLFCQDLVINVSNQLSKGQTTGVLRAGYGHCKK